MVEVGRRLYARGFVASNDSNISGRLDDRRLITTPKSVSKGFMSPDMMVVVDYSGNRISGDRDASSELPMHLEIYRNRPDVNAVVHAHPPIATGFAVAGIPLTRAVLAEVVTTLGSIPIAEYGTPSTAELEAVRNTSRRTTACCWRTTVRDMRQHRADAPSRWDDQHFADQLARAAWTREFAFARRGRTAPGTSRDVRHCGAGARVRRSCRSGTRPGALPGARSAFVTNREARARRDECAAAGEQRR